MRSLFFRPALQAAATALAFASVAFAEGIALVVPEKSFDFGAVPQGTKVVHEFVLENKGIVDIQIQKITPSCGCTAATVDSSAIKPGESGKIKVQFDTAGFAGSKVKTVEVLTSDIESPEVVLTVRGTVVPGVTAEPRKVEFGEISPSDEGGVWAKELAVSIRDGSDLKIEKVHSYSRFITVTPIQVQGGAGRYNVEISKDAPRGELRDRVVVQFEGDRQTALNIPVTAMVRGDLRLVPSTVSFGVVEGKEVLERRIKWENASRKGIRVTEVVAAHPAVEAAFVDVKAGSHGVVVVKIDPTKLAGDLRTTVQVKTDHPTESELLLNVFAVQPPK